MLSCKIWIRLWLVIAALCESDTGLGKMGEYVRKLGVGSAVGSTFVQNNNTEDETESGKNCQSNIRYRGAKNNLVTMPA